MRRLTLAMVLVFALAAPPAAMAGGKDRSPFAKGNRSGALLGQWWKTVLEIPASINPLTGKADPCITLGRHVLAPAFIPDGEISCTVGKNTSILAIAFTTECSDEEPAPFFGATPRERRACAIALDDSVTLNQVGIDGKTYDVMRYRYQSPDQKVRLPENDLFDVDARSLRFSADGWAPLLEPLAPGHHVITVRSAGVIPGGGPPFDDIGTLQLEVLGRGGHGHH
ncbi:MAG: hypothetical protein QOH46_1563 [Solirubrobacteraceae bacterium]|nr:hypothetical protein [Solirubrobacteraceae bacterium]